MFVCVCVLHDYKYLLKNFIFFARDIAHSLVALDALSVNQNLIPMTKNIWLMIHFNSRSRRSATMKQSHSEIHIQIETAT